MTFSAETFDVLVVGAGPAGSSAARLLAQQGMKVVLVDPQRHHSRRLELVGPRALCILEAVGLSHVLSDQRVSNPCQGIRKNWGRSGLHVDEFLRYPGGRRYVLDRAGFDAELLRMVRDRGVLFVKGTVSAVRIERGTVVADVSHSDNSTVVQANLVVDATGRPASIARRLGAKRTVHEHLVASLSHCPREQAPDQGQWLDINGDVDQWRYTLLGPGGARQFWSVRRGKRSSTRLVASHSWCDASSASLDICAGPRWLAVGDAAASYDPITSQGLVTALASALAASELVLSGRSLVPSERDEFSALIARTHARTEAGRQAIYVATA